MNFKRIIFAAALSVIGFTAAAYAQTYNAMSGGYNTGYGTVYGTFGLAQASQSMFNQMQIQMNMNLLRAAGKKNYGPTVAQPGEKAAKPSRVPPAPAPKYYGRFRPDATVDTGKTIADALAETPEEKALIKAIVDQTRIAFEKETAAKGWKNNIAGAFAFFIVATGTIHHGSPDPSDETVGALYEAMNQTIDGIPEFGRMSNRDKQGIYNTLIGFAGIPLAAYNEGKESNHEPTIETARQLAGQLIELVLKTSPERFKFVNGEMKFQ